MNTLSDATEEEHEIESSFSFDYIPFPINEHTVDPDFGGTGFELKVIGYEEESPTVSFAPAQIHVTLSKTFDESTPESRSDGEYSNSGFVYEDLDFSFAELVSELKSDFKDAHSSQSGKVDARTYLTSPDSTEDVDYFESGLTTSYSIHLSEPDDPKQAAAWVKAIEHVKGIAFIEDPIESEIHLKLDDAVQLKDSLKLASELIEKESKGGALDNNASVIEFNETNKNDIFSVTIDKQADGGPSVSVEFNNKEVDLHLEANVIPYAVHRLETAEKVMVKLEPQNPVLDQESELSM